jgi:hypothetical protein
MTISATSQGLKPGVVTSSNRPANPFDGMMIYETDTNLVRIWNGSAWKTLAYSDYTSGSVIQVASTTKTDTFTSTSGTYVDITGVSVSITPTSTSSKIFVTASGIGGLSDSAKVVFLKLVRGSTDIGISTGSAVSDSTTQIFAANSTQSVAFSVNYLDSPSSTSSLTYKLQGAQNTAGTNWYIGRFAANDNHRGITTITVMEIAG